MLKNIYELMYGRVELEGGKNKLAVFAVIDMHVLVQWHHIVFTLAHKDITNTPFISTSTCHQLLPPNLHHHELQLARLELSLWLKWFRHNLVYGNYGADIL